MKTAIGTKLKRKPFTAIIIAEAPPVILLELHHLSKPNYEVVLLHWHEASDEEHGWKSSGWHMPTDEEWGSRGWSYTNLADATLRYHALIMDQERGRRPWRELKREAVTA